MSAPRTTLARAEAFLESAIATRADIELVSELASECDQVGEEGVGDALRGLARAGTESAPAAVEAAAAALERVRGVRALSKPIPQVPATTISLNCLSITDEAVGAHPAIARVIARRRDLAERAIGDPAGFASDARSRLRSSALAEQRDIAWALGIAGGRDGTILLCELARLGRPVSDALATAPDSVETLRSIASESRDPAAAPERVGRAQIAASALVRRDDLAFVADIDSPDPIISAISSAARALETGRLRDDEAPETAGTDVAAGIEALISINFDADPSRLVAWAGWQSEADLELCGRAVAGWRGEAVLVDALLEQWHRGQPRTVWGHLLSAIDPPGLAAHLLSDESADGIELAGSLGSLDARISILMSASGSGPIDRAVAELNEPAAAELLISAAAESGPAGPALDGLVALGAAAVPALEIAGGSADESVVSIAQLALRRIRPKHLGPALGNFSGEIDIEEIADRFASSNEDERRSIIEALVATGGSESARALTALAGTASVEAAEALTSIDDPVARRCEEVLLASPYPDVARAAAASIADRGPAGVRYGADLARSEAPELACAGLLVLGFTELESAREPVKASLRTGDPWVARVAVESAGRIGADSGDKGLSRSLIGALDRAVGGAYVVVPAIAAIENEAALKQVRTLNENGHLFASGRNDVLLSALLSEGRRMAEQIAEGRAARREDEIERWRSEGRLEPFGGGRIGALFSRGRERRASLHSPVSTKREPRRRGRE